MKNTHCLKIGEEYLVNLMSEKKKVEIRINDRDYQVGDILRFGEEMKLDFEITHVHSGLGMEHGYVALSVKKII